MIFFFVSCEEATWRSQSLLDVQTAQQSNFDWVPELRSTATGLFGKRSKVWRMKLCFCLVGFFFLWMCNHVFAISCVVQAHASTEAGTKWWRWQRRQQCAVRLWSTCRMSDFFWYVVCHVLGEVETVLRSNVSNIQYSYSIYRNRGKHASETKKTFAFGRVFICLTHTGKKSLNVVKCHGSPRSKTEYEVCTFPN